MVLLACFLYGVNLGGWRTLGAHEALAAVPARAMLDGGDWVVPDFGGIPRVKKPPLGYWLIAAAGALTGTLDAAAARLPSAVGGVLLCGLVGRWGTRWYGRRAGLAAAVVQATSLWALAYGRKAEVDLTLALLVAAGLALILTAPPGESPARRRWRWAAVWVLAGVGWLGKFHFVPVLIFAPLVAHHVLARRWGELRHAASPVGLAAFAALALPWPLLVAARVPAAADAWAVQTAGRVGGALGSRTLAFYPAQLLLLTLPWTPPWVWMTCKLLRRHRRPLATGWAIGTDRRLDRRARAAWRGLVGERADRDLFPLVWLGATVAVLSVSLGRNRHYLLPALPACSLLAGRAVAVAVTLAGRGRTCRGMLRGGRAAAVAWGLPAAGAAAFGLAMTCGGPLADGRAGTAAFVRSLPGRAPAGEPVLVLGMGESSTLWHLPATARRAEDAAGLIDALNRRGRAAVLTDDRSAYLVGRCAAAWRAAGGRCAVTVTARGPGGAGPPRSRFEPLRGLRLLTVEVTPPGRRVAAAPTAGGGVVRR